MNSLGRVVRFELRYIAIDSSEKRDRERLTSHVLSASTAETARAEALVIWCALPKERNPLGGFYPRSPEVIAVLEVSIHDVTPPVESRAI